MLALATWRETRLLANDRKDDKDLENKENTETEDAAEGIEPEAASGESDDLSENSDSTEDDADPSGHDVIEDAEIVAETSSEDGSSEAVQEATDDEAEIADTPTEPLSEPAPAKSSSGIGAVFGGLVAGAIGFLAATFGLPENGSSGSQELSEQVSAAIEATAEQSALIEAVQSEIAELRDSVTSASSGSASEGLAEATAALEASIASVDARLGALADQVTVTEEQIAQLGAGSGVAGGDTEALGNRIAALEGSLASLMPDGRAAMEAQLSEFQNELAAVTEAARAEIAAVQERAGEIEMAAAAAEAEANKAAAVANLRAALENGSPFEGAIANLPDVPEALAEQAAEGVPTLASLQDEFPPLARQALSIAEAEPEGAGAGDRLVAFLRRQTNARSLAPQEGNSTNAILSRSEAALASGDLRSALSELEALSDGAKEIFAGWVSAAELRQSAIDAVETLSSSVN